MGNQQQQPAYLAQLAAKRKASGTDSSARKKKNSEIERGQARTRGHQDPPADVAQKQTPVTVQTLDVSTPPPPPPPHSARVPRPILWESGIVSALSTAIRAPDRFCDPGFSEASLQELKTIELNTLKAASLLESLASMQSRFGKTINELHVCQEEKKKTYEELLQAKKDYKRVNREHLRLQQTHATNSKSLSDFKIMYEDLEKKLQTKEDALKESLVTISKLEQEKKDAELDADQSRDALKVGVEGSFQNALDQIKLMNPGLELNLSGVHFMSYVYDGQILPMPHASPAVGSVTLANVGGEDDVSTAEKPVVAE